MNIFSLHFRIAFPSIITASSPPHPCMKTADSGSIFTWLCLFVLFLHVGPNLSVLFFLFLDSFNIPEASSLYYRALWLIHLFKVASWLKSRATSISSFVETKLALNQLRLKRVSLALFIPVSCSLHWYVCTQNERLL